MAFQQPKSGKTPLQIEGEMKCPYVKGTSPLNTCPMEATCPHIRGTSVEGDLKGLATVLMVGLNHQTAEVGLREKFFTDQLELMIAELRQLGLDEVAVLFTCNRIEVYGVGGPGAQAAVMEHFARRCGLACEAMTPHLYSARGHDAALHLLRVAAGLESMVLGEAQILGQVSDALTLARRAGSIGPVLGRMFEVAVAAGKRARAETEIGRHTLSISSAGVMLAKAARAEAGQEFTHSRVLIIGAGEMAKLAISSLKSHGVTGPIQVINRTPARAHLLALEAGPEAGVKAVAWSELRSALAVADVIIAATSSPVPVVAAGDLCASGRAKTFIDLGVPRNIDGSVSDVAGVKLHDIDALRQVVEQHRILRQREVGRVEAILEAEMERCIESLRAQEMAPVITAIRTKVESVVDAEVDRALQKLGTVDETTRAMIEQMAERIANKLLHNQVVALRSASGPRLASALSEVYGIEPAAKEPTVTEEQKNEAARA